VLDKDVIKSALLEHGMDDASAGPAAYESFFALADHMVGQGLSVVLDSPSFYESIPRQGLAIAGERRVPYFFIECICPDTVELSRRLSERTRMASNPGIESLSLQAKTITPIGAHLRLDTTQPIEQCLATALDYLEIASLPG
jgi:predicted kinase